MRKWKTYTPSQIRPHGWLKRQLELQAKGLSGNLDKVWRDVRDSAWIGGDAEGWERVPYWLDGFIPLAYLLKDEDMIRRAKKYIDAILAQQKPDGWICPCTDAQRPTYDTWAVQLISKVLVVYYECSGDERIPEAVYRALKNYYTLLADGTITLPQSGKWGTSRWYETFIAIRFVYDRRPEPWLKELAKLLKEQGLDFDQMEEAWKTPMYQHTQQTHIVNLAMMLKSEAVSHELLDQPYTDKAERYHQILSRYNGMPVGTYTGDECLAGLSPIHGTELCGVAEMMYSFEWLYACTGDPKWLERLELVTFNALPATISDDMWTHQYDQLSNQISCIRFPGRPYFMTNGPEAHLFGLEPHFGCCTANFNQAWPKFTLSTFMYNEDTVINTVPVPSRLETEELTVTVDSDYPFRNEIVYQVNTRKAFCLKLRVPAFAKNLKVNGADTDPTQELSFDFSAGSRAELRVSFEASPVMEDRPYDLKTVRWGNLIFALPIGHEKVMHEYVRNNVERKFPYCDYELLDKTPWNYGYWGGELELVPQALNAVPFSSEKPPVIIRTKAAKIDWGLEPGYHYICAKVPQSREPLSAPEEVILYPYGCAKLRMTELPLLAE